MWLKRVQVGLLHVAVTLTLLPINSTLNRVMINELAISATLVAALVSLPYFFSPLQVAIGSYADRHPLFGRRRTPYIALGLLLCIGGAVLSPQAAFVLAGNRLPGLALSLLAFGAWGMGFNFASVSYFSLASELDEEGRSRTIATMFFMMIISIIIMAIVIGRLVEPYTPQALQRAFFLAGGVAGVLGLLGLIGLEAPFAPVSSVAERHTWSEMARAIAGNPQARLFFVYLVLMLVAILGQDVLLEPYAAQAFGLPVRQTTRITSIWGVCFLLTLIVAGFIQRWMSQAAIARLGAWTALVGFVLISLSGLPALIAVFYIGVILLGLGTGFATVSNLALMLDMTTPESVGLYIGAWGMANAVSRLFGSVLSGAVRDLLTQATGDAVIGYVAVFAILGGLLLASLILLRRLDVRAFRERARQPAGLVEQAALAGEAHGG